LAALFALVVGAAGAGTLWLLARYNAFQAIVSDDAFDCAPVPGANGGEDIAVDWENHRAFISTGGLVGDIRRFDFDRAEAAVNVTPANLPIAFRGHGISLYAPEGGQRRLFVVNHGAGREQVTIFDVSAEGALSFAENLQDAEHLYDPNDIQAVGPRQFYVVNSTRLGGARYQSAFGALRFLLGQTSGSVAYFDGERFQAVAGPLTHGNGIGLSPDGARLYVAQTTGNNIVQYRRDIQSGALRLERTFPLPGSPDNISVSPNGELFVAAFPKLIPFVDALLHRRFDPQSGALLDAVPSQIVRVTPDSAPPVQRFWIDDGTLISGATVGAPFEEAGDTYRFFVSGFGRTLTCSPRA
jgi:arylesterase/paraoxonase